MKYLITTASGKLGTMAINHLLKKVAPEDIIATVRDLSKAKHLENSGVQIRYADYSNPESLVKAFTGVDRVLFISTFENPEVSRVNQHKNVANAAKEAGVQFIAYTSLANAKDSATYLAADHRETEQYLIDSQIPFSSLRNNWYLENELALLSGSAQGKPFVYAAKEGRVCWALEREYAEAAVNVLISENPKTIYELGGTASTYAELATALKEAVQNDFEVLQVEENIYKDMLMKAGMPEQFAISLAAFQNDIENGVLDVPSSDLKDVLGRNPATLTEAIREILPENLLA